MICDRSCDMTCNIWPHMWYDIYMTWNVTWYDMLHLGVTRYCQPSEGGHLDFVNSEEGGRGEASLHWWIQKSFHSINNIFEGSFIQCKCFHIKVFPEKDVCLHQVEKLFYTCNILLKAIVWVKKSYLQQRTENPIPWFFHFTCNAKVKNKPLQTNHK